MMKRYGTFSWRTSALLAGGLVVGVALAPAPERVEWVPDPSHSRIGFKIRHMGISDVSGEFTSWDLKVTTEGMDFGTAQVELVIDVNSIDTRNAKRDEHLRSCDFFCVEKYPQIRFVSRSIRKIRTEGKTTYYELTGDLTMHGQTHPVTLTLIHFGTIEDPWGNVRAGFNVEGKLDRYKWGIEYNSTLETGDLVIGREVILDIHIELLRKS